MLEISLRQLETFVVTAECASFTRAADKLHLTQSTVSTHIQSLEQELDSQLILRGARRKLELTETGRRVYAAAKEILNRCEALESMRESSDAATLSIATSTVPAQQLLPKLMSGFLKRNNAARFALRRGDSDAVRTMLEKGESVDKVDPIYYSTGYFDFTGVESARSKDDDIGDTYIEIDLTDQHLWYYEKGKKKLDTYIVSGQTTSEARTTLPGVYKLWSKETNKRMKDTNADGDEWDTKCNFWNNVSLCGIGLHDSTWRGGYFGGEIYKYNGSHGCINMSYDDAKYVYDNVPYGTPVVMYYKSAK